MLSRSQTDSSSPRLRELLAEAARRGLLIPTATSSNAIEEATIWTDPARPPLPFDEFSVALDGVALLPRQRDAFVGSHAITPEQLLDPRREIQEWVLVYGKGAGKDWLCARFLAWYTYVLLHLRGNVAEFMGMNKTDALAVMNVAPTQALARTVFFRYLTANIQQPMFAPWLYDHRQGGSQITSDEIRFPQINLTLYSMHSHAAGLEGKNLLAWCMDEADDFLETDGGSNAERVHDILRSSAATRLGNRWVGFSISYPRTAEGFIMRLYERAKSDATMFCDLAATWDVRPAVNRHTVKSIESDYQNKPMEARALYECIPMPTEAAFFEFPGKIVESVADHAPICGHMVRVITRTLRNRAEPVEFVGLELTGDIRPEPGRVYFAGCDAGETEDAYCISVWSIDGAGGAWDWVCPRCAQEPGILGGAHYARVGNDDREAAQAPVCGVCYTTFMSAAGWWRRQTVEAHITSEQGEQITLPFAREELLIRVQPQHGRGEHADRSIDFGSIEQAVLALARALPLTQIRCDPWQQTSLIQTMMADGWDAAKISFSNPEQLARAKLCKSMLYNGLIGFLPDNEWRLREWRRLQRVGRAAVDHPQGESKDGYDAEAIAIACCVMHRAGRADLSFMDGGAPPTIVRRQPE